MVTDNNEKTHIYVTQTYRIQSICLRNVIIYHAVESKIEIKRRECSDVSFSWFRSESSS